MKQVFFGLCIFSLSLFLYPASVWANIPPVANPGGPYQGKVEIPVFFDGKDSFDGDGDDLTYWWDFGDSTTAIGVAPSHAYAAAGTFTVTLTVRDLVGAEGSASTTATITPGTPISPIQPAHGAPAVSLNEGDLTLTLEWNAVPGAEGYKYRYWKQGDEIPAEPDFILTTDTKTYVPSSILAPGASYLWQVRACAVSGCGDWSSQWSFVFLLLPPPAPSLQFVPPATLDWSDVPGAQSYEISFPSIYSCPSWLREEIEGGEEKCSPLSASQSSFTDDFCFFKPNTENSWQIKACLGDSGDLCGSASIGDMAYISKPLPPAPILKQPFFNPAIPEDIPLVSPQDTLEWIVEDDCAYGYKLVIQRPGQTLTIATDQLGEMYSLRDIQELWDEPADLNSFYNWQVFSCLDENGLECEGTGSQIWSFGLIGAAPENLKPDNGSFVKIPFTLSWTATRGISYAYEIVGITQGTTSAPSKTFSYEAGKIMPGASYAWRVKTCVDEKGEVCGEWSETSTFTTFALLIPDTPNPLDEGIIQLDQQVSWKNVDAANAYAYHLEYACRNEKENKEECVAYGANVCPDTSAKKIIEDNKVTARNSFELPYCMGQYEWKALACLQDKCQDPPETRTTWSNGGVAWKLTAVQPPSAGAGLVPCGRFANDDATPYDETEKCQLKHAGFLLQNLLDFILWKVSLFVLLILAVITGATSYFSLGGPNALARIKTVFRSFFVGFLILMFAWMFVNIILMLFGFQFEFFGTWWEISF